MNDKVIYMLLIVLTIFSCNSKQENLEHMKPLTITKDSIKVPPFKIQLKLSDKANQKLKATNETIIVNVEFIGRPRVRIREKYKFEYYDETGRITIGTKTVELKNEREINFDNCKVSKELMELLENRIYEVTISVVSGRKSSKDNLLQCDFVQQNIEKIKNQTLMINGKLIKDE